MPITCRTNTKSDGVTSAPASGACPTCSTPSAAIGVDRQLDNPPSLRTVHLIGILSTSALAASAIRMSNFERAAEATRPFAGWTGLPAKVRFRAGTYRQLLALSDFDLSVRSSVTTKRKDNRRPLTFPNGKLHLIDATERIGGAS